jgi:peptidoglycan/LPS O-acetylase OafA/YrhL
MFRPWWASLTTLCIGAATWMAVSMFGGRREAWDSPLYFTGALPVIAIAVGVVAYLVPVRVWRWAMFPFWAQALVAFVQDPTANLLPLGLIVFSIFGAICLVPASIGAAMGRGRAAP